MEKLISEAINHLFTNYCYENIDDQNVRSELIRDLVHIKTMNSTEAKKILQSLVLKYSITQYTEVLTHLIRELDHIQNLVI